MTVAEMIKVYKMDLDDFETFAISKDYKFNKVVDQEEIYGTTYVKGLGTNTKFLTLNTKFFNVGKRVRLLTYKSVEFLNFKKELISKGFKLIKTESVDGTIKKTYTLIDWVFEIFNGVDVDGDAYFEINLTKP
jgi:hypothetical protein